MKVKDYKDLKVWQKGIEIVDEIYRISDNFPAKELYSLTSQMRRSAISIPCNIAEGFVRRHRKEYRQFLYISLGSCAELETQLIISQKRVYISSEDHLNVSAELTSEMKMLTSLIHKLTENNQSLATDD